MNTAQATQETSLTTVLNPSTGEVIGRYPELTNAELSAVIGRARAAQPAWNALPLSVRRKHIHGMRAWLVEHADDVAQTISACVGKTRLEALATEVMPSVLGSSWYSAHARRQLKPRRLSAGSVLFINKRSTVYRKPFGVVGIIAP
ncbi:MAG: aldehyde dehydrogenase family protein, partial [Gammaproteobacteria bacterium]|nr:aldehyde dehydrogenase family protein [Gammaproteobacteria bacterium]